MTVTGGDDTAFGLRPCVRTKTEPTPDRRKMAPRHVVGVAGEVFGGEFPIAGDDPFMHAADDLDAAFATIEENVQIPGYLPEILAQRRRLRVESGEQQSLVAVQLRHQLEAPSAPAPIRCNRLP